MKINKINIFNPYPWQHKFWLDKSFIILLSGSAGGGKSKCAGEKIHAYMKKYPGATGLILRKNRESMTNSTVLMMDRDIIGPDSFVNHRPMYHRFEYNNGSILAYGGMKDDSQREAIRSIGQKGGLDFVWMEEAIQFTENDFNEVLARVRGIAGSWRQVILSTNPDGPNHWINRRLILNKEASLHFSSAKDNPNNSPEYLHTLGRLSGVIGKRLREGLWIQAEGVIYKSFNPLRHIIKEKDLLPFKDYKEIIAGADSNYPKPRACIIIGCRGDGRRDIISEFYERNAKIETLGEWLKEKSKKYGRSILVYHDPSDPQSIDKLNNFEGVICEKAKNDVVPGISHVAGIIEDDMLFISETCKNFILELQSYCWQLGKEGDRPVKENDHLCDSCRYALFSEPLSKEFRFLDDDAGTLF